MTLTRTHWYSVLYAFIGLAVVFCAPYYVPMQPSASVSYHFGYNNRAGTILLVVFLGLGAIWTRGMDISFSSATKSQPVPRKVLVASLLAVLLGCLAMYVFAGRFGGFGESSYNIDRAWLLLQGKTPYADFEWPFGIYFLYAPVFLCHVFSLDVVRASYIVWGLTFLCGTLLLFAVVNMIDYPTTKKTSIFLLLMGAAYPNLVSMGTPGALLRHISPIFSILIVQRLFSRGGSEWRIWTALFAEVSTAVLLLISPEIAVAHAFACICIFLLDVERDKASSFAWSAGLLGTFALIFWTANRFHVLDTMLASAGGADSVPIIPAPHILLFLAGLFLCACYIYRRRADSRSNDNTIGIIAYSVPMIAAALGRCDAPHVFLDGLGVFLACLFYVSNNTAAWKWCRIAFLCFIIVVPTIMGIWYYEPFFASVFVDSVEQSKNSTTVDELLVVVRRHLDPYLSPEERHKLDARTVRFHAGKPESTSLSDVYPEWHGEFVAPFGYRPNHLGTELTDRIDFGFYEGSENARTPAAVRRKIGELASQPERALLLPEDFDTSECLANVSAEKRIISIMFLFPYRAMAVHPDSVYRPLCDYIHSEYWMEHEAPRKNGYALWVRKLSDKDPAALRN